MASGRNPFKNIDRHYFGLDWSAIIPLAADGTKYYVNHKTDLANRYMNKNVDDPISDLKADIDDINKMHNKKVVSIDNVEKLGFLDSQLENNSKGEWYFSGYFNYHIKIPFLEYEEIRPYYAESSRLYLGIIHNLYLFK